MIIIETCPRCGHDLTDLVIATYPPIPQKKCYGCGWEWTGEPEQVIRRPFGGNNIDIINQPSLNDYLNVNADNFSSTTTPYIVGRKINNEIDGTISNEELNNIKQNLKEFFIGNNYEQLEQ